MVKRQWADESVVVAEEDVMVVSLANIRVVCLPFIGRVVMTANVWHSEHPVDGSAVSS